MILPVGGEVFVSLENRILIVDDNRDIHEDIKSILRPDRRRDSELDTLKRELFDQEFASKKQDELSYRIDDAYQGEEAIKLVLKAKYEEDPYSLIFIDIRMPPGMDGIKTVSRIREIDSNAEIVIITAYSDYEWEEIIDKLGYSDKLLFIKKPFDGITIKQLALTLTTKWNLAVANKNYIESLELQIQKRTKNFEEIVEKLSKEISLRKQKEEQLAYAAHHDGLTGLYNRAALEEKLSQEINSAKEKNKPFAVIFVDIDKFKLINNTLGHVYGDRVIKTTSQMILKVCKEEELDFARFSADKFAILYHSEKDLSKLEAFVHKIMELFKEHVIVEGSKLHITVSMGIALFPQHGDSVDELIKNAETAVYSIKANGSGKYTFFDISMNEHLQERIDLEFYLSESLEKNEFRLNYQPQIDIKTGKVVGLEALVRWYSKELGFVPPNKFIKVAEENGFIIPLGRWILYNACLFAKKVQSRTKNNIRISVNVSAVELMQSNFVESVRQMIEETGISPEILGIEITETVLMSSFENCVQKISQLSEMGIEISLDDFGTGYSSLSYLKSLPINTIKIDKIFIDHIDKGDRDIILAEVMINIAEKLNMKVVAEGVETKEQLEYLSRYKCDMIQGYLFSKPLPEDEALAYIDKFYKNQ